MGKEEKMTESQQDQQQKSQFDTNNNAKKTKEEKTSKKKTTRKSKKTTRSKKDKLDALEKEIAELKDKYLRLSAEFDNYRKRTMNEKMELIKNASEKILLELLPIIDDFDRAIQASKKITDINVLKEGELLIYNKLKELIKKQGVEEVEAIGQELNTDYHEALTKIPTPKEELKGKIVDVVEKGYKLNDKVLRFAKVVIGE